MVEIKKEVEKFAEGNPDFKDVDFNEIYEF